MSFIISARVFTPAPEGVHSAVCVDVINLGTVDTQFGKKPKCRIVFEINKKMDDGRPFTAAKTYTVSLNEKSNLHKDLRSWKGKPFTSQELQGFDLERLIGAPCQVAISHVDKDGTTYANITMIMKPEKGKVYVASGSYKRAEGNGNNNPVADYDDSNPQDDSIDDDGLVPF